MLANRVRMGSGVGEIELPEGYVWATDEDFEFAPSTLAGTYYKDGVRGHFKYIGEGEYIAIPDTIQGLSMNSYFRLFVDYTGPQLKGVISYNKNITNIGQMFQGCSSLTSLDLSTFDTSNVTSMNNMFRSCSSLTSLDLSTFDTSNVTVMNAMFQGCFSLTSLNLNNFDVSSVTRMDYMFRDCLALTSLDLSSFYTSKVTNMNSIFYYCQELTSLNVSNFDTSKVTNMNSMFRDCLVLTSLDLSSFDTSKVTGTSSMFNNCNSIVEAYARTQPDADNFNNSTGKPINVNFVVI